MGDQLGNRKLSLPGGILARSIRPPQRSWYQASQFRRIWLGCNSQSEATKMACLFTKQVSQKAAPQ